MKSVAHATITLGMVAIPVKFYLAAAAKSVGFHLVTPKKNRVKMKFVDAATGDEVEKKECTRGYEFAKDQSVEFTEEEIASLGEDDNGAFEVDSFVPLTHLDPIRVEKSYFIAPDKGADRPYLLLLEVLKRTQKMFVARWINRGKRHVLAVAPRDRVLVAHQMYLDHEVRNLEVSSPTLRGPGDLELEMGIKLVDSYSKDSLDMSRYEDDYEKRVLEMAEKKLAGEQIVVPEAPKKSVLDLLEALKQSIK